MSQFFIHERFKDVENHIENIRMVDDVYGLNTARYAILKK